MMKDTSDYNEKPQVFSTVDHDDCFGSMSLMLRAVKKLGSIDLPTLCIIDDENQTQTDQPPTPQNKDRLLNPVDGNLSDSNETDKSEQDSTLKALEQSRNEDERTTAAFLRTLLKSEIAEDRSAANRLLTMLKERDQRKLAINIACMSADFVSGLELAELFKIIDDRSKTLASNQMIELINDSENQSSIESIRQLLWMLAADDQQRRGEGQYMVDMLNGRNTTTDGVAMLRVLSHDPIALSGLIELRRDPERQQIAADVLELVKSSSDSDTITRIIPLLTCSEINTRERDMTRQDGETLLNMLKGSEIEKQRARNIIAVFDKPEQIRQFLSIVENSANRVATEQLYRMIGSEQDSGLQVWAAVDLINLLDSNTGYRRCGERLLGMLNSSEEQTRLDSIRCLRCIKDVEELNAVVSGFGKPELKQGLRKILDGLESASAGEREISHRFMDALLRPSSNEKDTAEALIKMLASDRDGSTTARIIISKLDSSSDRATLLGMLNDSKHRNAARMIVSDLNGTNARAAVKLVKMCELMDDKVSRLLNFYAGMDKREDALLLLKTLNPTEIHQLLDLRQSDKDRAAANELMKMLNSGDLQKITSVASLLRELGSPVERERAAAQRQLEYLGGDMRTSVQKMMANINELHEQLTPDIDAPRRRPDPHARLVSMLADEVNREAARRLIDLSATDPSTANRLLRLFRDNNELKTAVYTITDRNRPHAAEQFKRLVSEATSENNSEARELVRTIIQNEALGTEILGQLNDPRRYDEGVSVLNPRLSLQERRALRTLYNNPRTHRAAAVLSEALASEENFDRRQGAISTLQMLGSALSRRAEEFVELLSKPDNARARALLDCGPSPSDIAAFIALPANNGAAIDRLFASGNVAGKRAVLQLLSDASAGRRSAGQKILSNLTNPAERFETERMLALFTSSQAMEKYLELTSPPPNASTLRKGAANELRKMLTSGDPRDATGVANLMEIFDSNRQAEELFLALALPGARGEEARTILSNCSASTELTLFIRLKFNDSRRAAYTTVLDMLKSEDRTKRESARALVGSLGRGADGLIDGLNNPLTKDIALKGLEVSKSPEEIANAQLLFERSEFHSTLEDLHRINQDPSTRSDVSLALSLRSPAEIKVFVDLQKDPRQKEAFRQISAMLSSDDLIQIRGALLLLGLLAGPSGSEKNSALSLVRMLNDQHYQPRAELVLESMSAPLPSERFLRLLYSSENTVAGDFLAASMNKPESLPLLKELSNMLASENVNISVEAARLVRMLNKREEQAAAMRLLERRVQRTNARGNVR